MFDEGFLAAYTFFLLGHVPDRHLRFSLICHLAPPATIAALQPHVAL